MVFGIAKATGGTTNWEEVSDGNKIQVFAQILYGYGYWGPFALEYESAKVSVIGVLVCDLQFSYASSGRLRHLRI